MTAICGTFFSGRTVNLRDATSHKVFVAHVHSLLFPVDQTMLQPTIAHKRLEGLSSKWVLSAYVTAFTD